MNKGASIDLMVSTLDEHPVHDGHLPHGLVPDRARTRTAPRALLVRRPADAPRRPAQRHAPGGVPDGDDAERPELRHDRVQLDAELHAQRPDELDDGQLHREAQAPRRAAARELHDLRRPRRLAHRAGRLRARRHHVAGVQLLGRHGQQQRRLQPLRPLQRPDGDNNGPRAYTVSFDRPYFDGQARRRRRALLRLGLPDDPLDGVAGLRHGVRDVRRPRAEPEPVLGHACS